MQQAAQTQPNRSGYDKRSARTRPGIVRDIVDVFDRSQTMASVGARDLLVEQVQAEMNGVPAVPVHAVARLHLAEITQSCARVTGGLAALAVVFAHLTNHSPESVEVSRLADEWQAFEFFYDVDLTALSNGRLNEIKANEVVAEYRLATEGRRTEVPRHCSNAREILNHLAGLNSAADGLPPAVQFLEMITKHLAEVDRQAIADFVDRRRNGWGLSQIVEQPRPDAEGLVAWLIIQIKPVSDGYYLVSHWRQAPTKEWQPVRQSDVEVVRHRLEPLVERLVNDAEVAWADEAATAAIQFILPFELLDEPVETWARESDSEAPSVLILDYPIVVRSLERMQAREWHRSWRNRWKKLVDDPESSRIYAGSPDYSAHRRRVEDDLKSVPEYVSIILANAPGGGGAGEAQLLAALRSGLPLIVWNRHDCSDPAFRTAAEDILSAGADLSLVSKRAREWMLASREADDDGESTSLWQMAVMFDDPTRQLDRPRQGMER